MRFSILFILFFAFVLYEQAKAIMLKRGSGSFTIYETDSFSVLPTHDRLQTNVLLRGNYSLPRIIN